MRYLVSLVCLLSMLVVLSCTESSDYDPDFNVGDSFADSQLRVIQIDTLSLETSTMQFDSLITSTSNRILIGSYNDPEFGTVTCASFFEVLPENFSINSEAVYDSIVMYMKYDSYYYNDTLQLNEIHIKKVTEQLKPKKNAFYNTSNIAYSNEDISMLAYYPRPMEGDTISIKMDNVLGATIFDKIQTKNITNTDEFKAFLKGIMLRPGGESGSIIGFSTDETLCFIRLFYSTAGETGSTQDYIDLKINKGSEHPTFFNQITAKDANQYLEKLTDQEESMPSTTSENKTFIQAGTGITTQIKFPTIKSLYDIEGTGTILEATLIINPSIDTYNDYLSLKDTLNLYLTDRNNVLSSQLTYADGTAVKAVLNKNNLEFNEIYYTVPIGAYVEFLLTNETETDQAIALLPTDYTSSVDRMILNGPESANNAIKLQLIYTVYDREN
ncbi:DUF4270 family protein [Galbibacter sp. PAP.153]|uniref:DUF4270 family protein n=1 Tax=Galbibacter sp. PAP.153 TaxID=3104623 RepID=UPI00300886A5